MTFTFDDFDFRTPLNNALADMGYVQPTPIQIDAFPVVLSGKDVIGIAQTGTGKTLAYLLPLLRQFKFSKEIPPRILIVVPTRELVVQVVKEIEKLTAYMNVRVAGFFGGKNINTQKQVVKQGLDIVVGTPGRLTDLMLTGILRTKLIRKLVIDEVDELFNLGFRTQIYNLIDLLPEKRQNLLFSATMTEDVETLVKTFLVRPQKIEVDLSGTPAENVAQSAYLVPNFNSKANLLQLLLTENQDLNKVLVFTATKKLADRLFELLKSRNPNAPNYSIGVIHSNKSQNFRLNTVERFHNGTTRILIATDIIARGIDISEVSHVINFDVPDVPLHYIHRIGRTGRADKTGKAISFITPTEEVYQKEIEQVMGFAIDMLPLPEHLELSDELIEEEMPVSAGDKAYLKNPSLKKSKGAYHEKKAKNLKVNLAKQKRRARMEAKKNARRRKK